MCKAAKDAKSANIAGDSEEKAVDQRGKPEIWQPLKYVCRSLNPTKQNIKSVINPETLLFMTTLWKSLKSFIIFFSTYK